MGCQISSGKYDVRYSTGAWLVAYITGPWFNEITDTDGEGYHETFSNFALTEADRCAPWTYEGFLSWAAILGVYYNPKIDRDDFNTARQFIHDVALTGECAYLSY